MYPKHRHNERIKDERIWKYAIPSQKMTLKPESLKEFKCNAVAVKLLIIPYSVNEICVKAALNTTQPVVPVHFIFEERLTL